MKLLKSLVGALLLGAGTSVSQAATTFTIGAQAVANPPGGTFTNVWPSSGGENPANAIDGGVTVNKYLNFAKNNTGYIYSLSTGTTAIVTGINFISGNDAPGRTPSSFTLFGSNSTTATTTAGTIYDVEANFTLISGGALSLSALPSTAGGNVTFANSTAFNTYLLVFPTVVGSLDAAINSMQIGEARLQTAAGPLDNTGVIGGGQLSTNVPETGSAALIGLAGLAAVRRRRSA